MAKNPDTRELCEELLRLRSKHPEIYAREKEIKTLLIAAAAEAGDNFKITIDKLGFVKVSAPKDKRCTGIAPEIVVEAYLALPAKDKAKLAERGIVRMAEQWKAAYYGSVTPELF